MNKIVYNQELIKDFTKCLLLIVASIGMLSCKLNEEQENSYNRFYPGKIWVDNNGVHINAHGGGILANKNTYYWYGEHKIEGIEGNFAQVGVHCYSSKDLYNWKNEGIALEVIKDDPNHEITKGCIIERPKVVYNKKQIVL